MSMAHTYKRGYQDVTNYVREMRKGLCYQRRTFVIEPGVKSSFQKGDMKVKKKLAED
jgi:hypothetical protein